MPSSRCSMISHRWAIPSVSERLSVRRPRGPVARGPHSSSHHWTGLGGRSRAQRWAQAYTRLSGNATDEPLGALPKVVRVGARG